MKKILAYICCISFMFSFISCNAPPQDYNTESLGTVPTITTETQVTSQNEFFLSSTIQGAQISDHIISFSVPNSITSFSFINTLIIPSQYKWELHWDKECLPSLNIVSKTVDLDEGENQLYALFINKENFEDVHFYEIKVYRAITTNDELQVKASEVLKEFVDNYMIDYPNDYVTPAYLIEYLQDVEGYSADITLYVVEHFDIDWIAQAKCYINTYLTYEEEFGFAATWWYPDDIQEMLYEERFSTDVINSVMSSIDWFDQAAQYLKHLSDFYDNFDRVSARDVLREIVANENGVNYLLENSNVDWNKHAYYRAKDMLDEYSYSTDELTEELYNVWEFTESEIRYAVEKLF